MALPKTARALRESPAFFTWSTLPTLIGAETLLWTLLMQRAEHRDTQALHAKLDELLRAESRARSSLTRLDDEKPEEIERRRMQTFTSPYF